VNVLDFAEFGFTALAALGAYLLTQAPPRYHLKWILIPAVIAFGVFIQLKLPLLLGTPALGAPPREFALIDYRAFQTPAGEHVIEMWVLQKGEDDTSLWRVPYSEATAQGLQKIGASHGQAHGQFQRHGDGLPTHPGVEGPPALNVITPPVPPMADKDGGGSEGEED
jgi:hypothetical protein